MLITTVTDTSDLNISETVYKFKYGFVEDQAKYTRQGVWRCIQ